MATTTGQKPKYGIENRPDRRLPAGGPLLSEHYGSIWVIGVVGASPRADPVVLVPDPGDGSALPLAERIVDFLNSADRGA